MQVTVHFYSYFKDLTGCAEAIQEIPNGSTITDLFEQLAKQFTRLAKMKRATLVAIGVDYQTWDYVLQEGDKVSLFPPVQGG